MTKVALGIGDSYGRGAMVRRTGKTFSGAWGAPAMYSLEGGSFGLQLGGESTDVVLRVMNDRGVDALLNSKVKLGGGASAAAGPRGRNIEASTDASLRAEILSSWRFPARTGPCAELNSRPPCPAVSSHPIADNRSSAHLNAAGRSRRRASDGGCDVVRVHHHLS